MSYVAYFALFFFWDEPLKKLAQFGSDFFYCFLNNLDNWTTISISPTLAKFRASSSSSLVFN